MNIYKYTLDNTKLLTGQKIEMPRAARALRVNEQNGRSVLWAMVDIGNPPAEFWIDMIPTGGEAPPLSTYFDTYFTERREYVWHFFIRELKKARP